MIIYIKNFPELLLMPFFVSLLNPKINDNINSSFQMKLSIKFIKKICNIEVFYNLMKMKEPRIEHT